VRQRAAWLRHGRGAGAWQPRVCDVLVFASLLGLPLVRGAISWTVLPRSAGPFVPEPCAAEVGALVPPSQLPRFRSRGSGQKRRCEFLGSGSGWLWFGWQTPPASREAADQGCSGGLPVNAYKYAETNDLCTEAEYASAGLPSGTGYRLAQAVSLRGFCFSDLPALKRPRGAAPLQGKGGLPFGPPWSFL